MRPSAIEQVCDTAFLFARCRAEESARSDALFHDPLAALLAGDRGRALVESFPAATMTRWTVAIRTVVIDDYISAGIARGVDTVLSLGAGLDTRPYRLDLPRELSWIEVDYSHLIAYKERRLEPQKPCCHLERLGLDLANPASRDALITTINAHSRRVLVLTEGLVPYLDLEQAARLADDLRALSGADSWIVDYVSPEAHAYREQTDVPRHMCQAPFEFQPDDWFAFFAGHGWRTQQIRYLPEEGARLGRPAPLPWRLRALMPLVRLPRPYVPAERRATFNRSSGFVLLEPVTSSQVSGV